MFIMLQDHDLFNIKVFLLIIFATVACGDRMTTKIYDDLEGNHYCFRRLNATHQIGCTSDPSGNVGVIHIVDSAESLKWVVQDGPDWPYIPALNVEYFNMNNMKKLINSKRITGVLVLQGENDTHIASFSPENSCPNENTGLYVDDIGEYAHCSNGTWNPDNPALGMFYRDWTYPIALITNDTQIYTIRNDCFKRFNEPVNGTSKPWPLCAAEMTAFMLGAKDSATCMRRSNKMTNMNPVNLCDPLGSRNVITMLFPTTKEEPLNNDSVVIVAARLDSVSMFDGIAPGGDSAVTGLVTLLSVAQTLTSVKEEIEEFRKTSAKNVLFALFNGEAFDYIGSSRAVFDMERKMFPEELQSGIEQLAALNLSHFSHFIELSQLSPKNDNNYWLHTDPVSMADQEVELKVHELVKFLINSTPDIGYQRANRSLPPASFQRFLKKNLKLPGVVIGNFQKKFSNNFYNGRFDTEASLSNNTAEYLTKISTSVSRTVYKILTNQDNISLTANQTLIEQLIDCYLNKSSCILFQEIASPSKLGPQTLISTAPYSLYVNVFNKGRIYPSTIYTRYLLAYLTGDKMQNYDQNNCTANSTDKIFEYDWMVGPDFNASGICVKSIVKYTDAVSPADVLNDWQSKEYSTWTESVWQKFSLRIFLRPSRALEGLTLGLGFAIFIISFVLVYSINKRASILFGSRSLAPC